MTDNEPTEPTKPVPGYVDPLADALEPELEGCDELEDTPDQAATNDAEEAEAPAADLEDIRRHGFVPLHRAFFEEWWWTDERWSLAQLFLWMIASANYTSKTRKYRGTVVKIPVGSLVTSRSALAERTGMKRDTISHILKNLEKAGEIEITDTSNAGMIVRICHYARYTEMPQRRGQRPGGPKGDRSSNLPQSPGADPADRGGDGAGTP